MNARVNSEVAVATGAAGVAEKASSAAADAASDAAAIYMRARAEARSTGAPAENDSSIPGATGTPDETQSRSALGPILQTLRRAYSKLLGIRTSIKRALKNITKIEGVVKAFKKFTIAIKNLFAPILAFFKPLITLVSKCFSFAGNIGEVMMDLMEEHKLAQHFKIIISFVQILGSFVTFQVEWPPALTDFMSNLGAFFQFNVVELPKLSCLWAGVDFQTTLIATTAGPIAIMILLALPTGVCRLKAIIFGWTDASKEQYTMLVNQCFANLLFGSFLIYPVSSLNSLQAFDCHESLGVLRVDMRVTCPPFLSFMGIYSLCCFFVYPIGMPFAFWWILKAMKVPQLARMKRINRAFTNLLALFNKSIGTFECKLIAQMIGKVENDGDELERRVADFYERVILLHNENSDGHEAHENDLHLHSCLRKHFQLADDEELDNHKVGIVSLIHKIVERANAFVGLEALENLTLKQGALLLEHAWPKAGAPVKSKAAMKQDMIKDMLRRYGTPAAAPEWVSPFGNFYPDPTNEENHEFYLGVDKEKKKVEEEEARKKEEEEEENKKKEKEELQVKRKKSLIWRASSKITSSASDVVQRASTAAFFLRKNVPEKDEETKKKEEEAAAEAKMLQQLQALVLRLLDSNLISCPVLNWDANSPDEDEQLAVKRVGPIIGMFHVETWYWELIEMLRKFMMVAVLVFIFPGEPAQLGVGLLIVFYFLVWHLLLQPFATTDLNRMQAVSQISLMLTLFVGIMLIIDKYMQRELELLTSGPWGFVDSGQAYLQELNRTIFLMMGIAVNVFAMCGTPILMAIQIFRGLGTPQEMLTKARDQVNCFVGCFD
jgi:hypothetical protein